MLFYFGRYELLVVIVGALVLVVVPVAMTWLAGRVRDKEES